MKIKKIEREKLEKQKNQKEKNRKRWMWSQVIMRKDTSKVTGTKTYGWGYKCHFERACKTYL